jgi:hypothetical protein
VVLREDEIPWTASHKVAKAALIALVAERVVGARPGPPS